MHPELTKEAQSFIEDCAFAKVVSTPSGPGILIGGMVFHLQHPLMNYEIDGRWPDYTEALVIALRRGTSDKTAASGLHGLATAGHIGTAA